MSGPVGDNAGAATGAGPGAGGGAEAGAAWCLSVGVGMQSSVHESLGAQDQTMVTTFGRPIKRPVTVTRVPPRERSVVDRNGRTDTLIVSGPTGTL